MNAETLSEEQFVKGQELTPVSVTPNLSSKWTRALLIGVILLFSAIFLGRLGPSRPHESKGSQPHQPRGIRTRNLPMGQNRWRLTAMPTPGRLATFQASVQKRINYGGADGEVGMIQGDGQTPVGPESFAVGLNGSVLVADLVNERVLVFSGDATYLHCIDLPGIVLNDIAVDQSGSVYVYDGMRQTLYKYDSRGTPQSALRINPDDVHSRGYFHVADNSVYFADAATRDILIAAVQNGLLTAPDASLERISDGIHGPSGRVYSVDLVRGQALQIRVQHATAPQSAPQLQISLPAIVSATYVGEDGDGRFYVQSERLIANTVVLQVHVFSPIGDLLAVSTLPENDYALWTAKLVDVGRDGAVIQFLPRRNYAKLSIF